MQTYIVVPLNKVDLFCQLVTGDDTSSSGHVSRKAAIPRDVPQEMIHPAVVMSADREQSLGMYHQVRVSVLPMLVIFGNISIILVC